MSILMIFIALMILFGAAYLVQQSGWPSPMSWVAYGLLFCLAILLFLKVSGIALN